MVANVKKQMADSWGHGPDMAQYMAQYMARDMAQA
jgi:hypothetical protein